MCRNCSPSTCSWTSPHQPKEILYWKRNVSPQTQPYFMPWGEETLDTSSGPHPYSGVIVSCSAKRPWIERKLHWLSLSREVFQAVLSASKMLAFSLQHSCYIPLLIWTACVPPQQVTLADREQWDHSHILSPPLSINSWHLCSLQTPTNPMHGVAHIQQHSSSRLPASRPAS